MSLRLLERVLPERDRNLLEDVLNKVDILWMVLMVALVVIILLSKKG